VLCAPRNRRWGGPVSTNFGLTGFEVWLSETCRGNRSGLTAQRVNLLRRRGGRNGAGRAIVSSSRRQNLDRDTAVKLAAPVAVPSLEKAYRATFAVYTHVDGFRRDCHNSAKVPVQVHVIVGQRNALSYSK
jgi:hypothetical protein